MAKMIMDAVLGNKSEVIKNIENMNVACGDIHHLWAHLVMRYDVLHLNMIYEQVVNDVDFKTVIITGRQKIEADIKKIEGVLDKLGVVLPEKPPATISKVIDPKILTDQFVYFQVYAGVQGFIDEFTRSLRSTQNPEISGMYIRMLKKELDYYQDLSSFGKLKGWLRIPPAYHASTT